MKIIFKITVLSVCSMFAVNAFPVQVFVGEITFEVPEPDAFVLVSPEMEFSWKMFQILKEPGMDCLGVFISQEDALKDKTGLQPQYKNYHMLHISSKSKNLTILESNFPEYKKRVHEYAKELTEKDKEHVSELNNKLSTDMTDTFEIDFDISTSNIIFLPINFENEYLISFSKFVRYTESSQAENIFQTDKIHSYVKSITETSFWANGKIFVLYTYGKMEDMKWTQDEGMKFAESIRQANPVSFKVRYKKSLFSMLIDHAGIIVVVSFCAVILLFITFTIMNKCKNKCEVNNSKYNH